MNKIITVILCLLLSSCGLLRFDDSKSNEISSQPSLAEAYIDHSGLAEGSEKSNWILDPKLTINENLVSWGKIAGWTIDWRLIKDYRTTGKAVFLGEFEGEQGVVTQLLSAIYSEKGQPINSTFQKGNRTVVIKKGGYYINDSKEVK